MDQLFSTDNLPENLSPKILQIAKGEYINKRKKQIQGSGYVVESLEAALWSFRKSSNFREAILEAVNLGRDADTTGAICGQIAGAYWGKSSIPASWLEKLVMGKEIEDLATDLIEAKPNHD